MTPASKLPWLLFCLIVVFETRYCVVQVDLDFALQTRMTSNSCPSCLPRCPLVWRLRQTPRFFFIKCLSTLRRYTFRFLQSTHHTFMQWSAIYMFPQINPALLTAKAKPYLVILVAPRMQASVLPRNRCLVCWTTTTKQNWHHTFI